MSNTSKRKIAIVGAGLAGTTVGLGLVDAGFDVTIYSDRDRASLRNNVPPTGTAVYFGNRSSMTRKSWRISTTPETAPA